MCYTYDRLSRVLMRTVKDLNNIVLSTESYSYDAVGNAKNMRQTFWSASILLIFRFLAVFAPTEGGTLVSFAELVVEEAGVFIAHGDDDIAHGQIGLLQKSDRLTEALLLQKSAEGRAAKLAYTLGKVGDAQSQFVR